MAAKEFEPTEVRKDPTELTFWDVVTPIFDAAMGERLATVRMKRFWRIEDLAPKLGLNQETLRRLEAGEISIPKHAFSVSKLEDVIGETATKYVLLNRYAASYDPGMIRANFWNKVTRERKRPPRGQHWTQARIKAGLPTQGHSFMGIPGDIWDRAMKLHKEANPNSDFSTQTKGVKGRSGKKVK